MIIWVWAARSKVKSLFTVTLVTKPPPGKFYFILFVCLFVYCVSTDGHACRGQRTVLGYCFSPSPLWVLKIKLRRSGLATSALPSEQTQPPPPYIFFLNRNLIRDSYLLKLKLQLQGLWFYSVFLQSLEVCLDILHSANTQWSWMDRSTLVPSLLYIKYLVDDILPTFMINSVGTLKISN